MLSNNALRVLATAGVIAACASTQACDPNSDEINVRTQDGLSPKGCTGTVLPTGACAPPPPIGGGTGTAGSNDHPRPPAGYTVKWSTCSKWIEGGVKMRNNSRVVKPAADGTVVLTNTELNPGNDNNHRRIKLANLPKSIAIGTGVDMTTKKSVNFVKIGQTVILKAPDGTTSNWIVSSENLGAPQRLKNGKLSYLDWCYRNPQLAGKDTMGQMSAGAELSATCVVEDSLADYNALSAEYPYWSPIYNYADTEVAMLNSPVYGIPPHPEAAVPVKVEGTINWYSGWSAALNDINGTERDDTLTYLGGERFCHYMVNGGFEVPASKRPGTLASPAPGVPNGKTYLVWRPVSKNVNIANREVPPPDPVEPEPDPATTADAVPESDTTPM